MDPSGEQRMKPIPIAQYLNRFERAEPTPVEATPRRHAVLLKPRSTPVPVVEDAEAGLHEAFERGRQEGFAAARAEAAAALARQTSEQKEWMEAERLAFQTGEYARLADEISAGLFEIEERIAQTVAGILRPYLAQEQSKRVIQALSENLGRILSGDSPALLKIAGPEYVLNVLRDRLSKHPVKVEYSSQEGMDVTVEAQHTIIKSQLQAWIDLIDSTVG
jgi:flagellar biosynthesis/type III secretory pathway protein FliH